MSGRLRRRYERLLFTYPAAYRRAHGDEMLGTLLEAARPDQRLPAPREALSLLLGGLRTRAHQVVARYSVPAAVLAVLAWSSVGRPRSWSWWWLVLPAAAALPLEGDPWAVAQAGLQVGLLLVVLVVAVGALDPRPAIGAAVYLVPGLVYAAEEAVTAGVPSTLALGYWVVLARRPQRAQP